MTKGLPNLRCLRFLPSWRLGLSILDGFYGFHSHCTNIYDVSVDSLSPRPSTAIRISVRVVWVVVVWCYRDCMFLGLPTSASLDPVAHVRRSWCFYRPSVSARRCGTAQPVFGWFRMDQPVLSDPHLRLLPRSPIPPGPPI